MLATTMQVAVRSEIVGRLRAEEPVLTGDHLAVGCVRFKSRSCCAVIHGRSGNSPTRHRSEAEMSPATTPKANYSKGPGRARSVRTDIMKISLILVLSMVLF